MRIFVIGGTGFIGRHLVSRLVELGHDVGVLHRGQTHAELPRSVREFCGDRHRLSEHGSELKHFVPEVVVDTIAYTEEDARNLVEVARGLARRLVVLSSGDVYLAYGRLIGTEPGPAVPTPLAEDAPVRSVLFPYRARAAGLDDFLYSYDKLPVERVLMSHPSLPATVLRLPMTFGPGDASGRLSTYLKRMDDRRPAIVLEAGLARIRFPRGYVENVAAAIALAVEDDRSAGRIYNVAEQPALSEAEWIRKIGLAVGWRGEILTAPKGRIPSPFHCDQDLDMDSQRIRRDLGFAERVGLEEALERTIAWERSHPAEGPLSPGLLDYAAEDALLAELNRR
jgi:nucleoside-diphosphate-sugar epimerase